MEIPLQITFDNMPHSNAVADRVSERARRLEKYCDAIVSCRVTVQAPQHRHATGNRYVVRVELSVPGTRLVVGREGASSDDVYVAISDAFDSARRLLEEYVRRRRGEVKARA